MNANIGPHFQIGAARSRRNRAFREGRFQEAREIAEQVYAQSGNARDLAAIALILKGADRKLGDEYSMKLCRILADTWLASAERQFLPARDRAYVLYALGRILLDRYDALDESIVHLTECVLLFEQLEEPLAIVALRNAMILSDVSTGDFKAALHRIKDNTEARGMQCTLPRHAIMTMAVNMHMVLQLAGAPCDMEIEFDPSERELHAYHLNNCLISGSVAGREIFVLGSETLRAAEQSGCTHALACVLNNLGVITGERDKLKQALKLCQEAGYSVGEAIVKGNLTGFGPPVYGVLSTPAGMLWPALKHIDLLPDEVAG